MSNIKNFYKATILKLDDEFAILKIFNDQEIKWQKNKLPDNLKEGDTFYLTAQKDIFPTNSRGPSEAIRLLEEILNGEQEKK